MHTCTRTTFAVHCIQSGELRGHNSSSYLATEDTSLPGAVAVRQTNIPLSIALFLGPVFQYANKNWSQGRPGEQDEMYHTL